MAILTAEARRKLKTSDFAIPEERKYPIHDESHARNALSRVGEFGSPAEKDKVRAAVHKRYPNIGKEDSDGDNDSPEEESKESPEKEMSEEKKQKKIQSMYK